MSETLRFSEPILPVVNLYVPVLTLSFVALIVPSDMQSERDYIGY